MKKHLPISVQISVHIHATESESTVMEAIRNILPSGMELNEFRINREEFKGHHGNPIKRLELSLSNPRKVRKIFSYIFRKMKGIKYDGWISERFDSGKNKLYLRIDKQSAYLGEIRISEGDDVIRIVFTFPGYKKIDGGELEEEIGSNYP